MNRLKKLIGERVYLSPIELSDYEKFAVWMNDFQVTDYTGRSHAIFSYEAEKAWTDNAAKEEKYFMAIVTKEDDEVIGNINLIGVDNINRSADLGIMIGEADKRSKGYGTEAICLLLDFAFNYLNIENVGLTLLGCNDRAKRCYEKAGFKEFGRRRKCKFVNGKYYDQIYMDILKEEFNTEYIKNKNVR